VALLFSVCFHKSFLTHEKMLLQTFSRLVSRSSGSTKAVGYSFVLRTFQPLQQSSSKYSTTNESQHYPQKPGPFVPSYYHVLEKLIDFRAMNLDFIEQATENYSGRYSGELGMGIGWTVKTPPEGFEAQELTTWTDGSCFPKGIMRIEIESNSEHLSRFVEIHWVPRMCLLHQHDRLGYGLNIPDLDPYLDQMLQGVNPDANKIPPGIPESLAREIMASGDPLRVRHGYLGFNIPLRWMNALKQVQWPKKTFEPDYPVDYTQFFTDLPLMENLLMEVQAEQPAFAQRKLLEGSRVRAAGLYTGITPEGEKTLTDTPFTLHETNYSFKKSY
jgi:hypothetical protein